jgi:hypothetical protein
VSTIRWTCVALTGLIPARLATQQSLPAQQSAPAREADAVVMSFRFFAAHYGGLLVSAFDAIPSREYTFRPTRTQQSIGFIAQHLEGANYGPCSRLGPAKRVVTSKDSIPDSMKAAWPKDTLVARLRASLAFCDAALSRLDDEELGEPLPYGPSGSSQKAIPSRVLVGYVTDLAEHYAQLASYMRRLGMVPPSALPPKQRVAIELSTDRLAPYVGTYDLPASAFQAAPAVQIQVRLRDRGLYVQPTGAPEARLWPESVTDFFVRDVDAQITFTRNASGAVTGLVLHQNGEDRGALKVK